MRRVIVILVLLLLLLAAPLFWHRPAKAAVYDLAVFNTIGRLVIWELDRSSADNIARDVIANLQNLHNCLNIFASESEVSRLNRTPPFTSFHCSDTLWQVLLSAREAYQLTDGAFDISVGPLMQLWGFHRKRDSLPSAEEIEQALNSIGLDKLLFDEATQSVAFTQAGMSLDFGGLAKGFALDYIRPLVEKQGCQSYMLNLGGNIYCSEKPPPGQRQAFQIGIRDPADANKIVRTLALRGRFISTSANYERAVQIGEKKIGHLLDPRSGKPVQRQGSVTVLTSKGAWSDAFSTAVFVDDEKLAKKLAENMPDTEIIFLP